MKTSIPCSTCGHEITPRHLFEAGLYIRLYGVNYIYIRFCCPYCKRVGDKFVEQEKWDWLALSDPGSHLTPEEREKFAKMGKIEIAEIIEFHNKLEDLKTFEEV